MNAMRADDGAIRWQTGDLGVRARLSGRFYSTPAVAFGRVYAGNVDGRVYSFDRQTGRDRLDLLGRRLRLLGGRRGGRHRRSSPRSTSAHTTATPTRSTPQTRRA